MNANEIINSSLISRCGISDGDVSLDGSKTFADIKAAVVEAINVVVEATPKVKASGANMTDASFQAEGIFKKAVRNRWGDSEIDFYVTKDGHKAITGVDTHVTLDDIGRKIRDFVANY